MIFKRFIYIKRAVNFRAARCIFPALLVLLLLFFSISLGSCDSGERIIKIGNQCVLTGGYKSFGEEQMVSMKLAASKLSPVRIGGFDYKIEIITKDDEGNPEKAFLIAQEMVDEGVSATIGSTFDGTTQVSLPVYEGYGIPLLSPFAQKAEISEEGGLFFRMIINNEQKVENIARFIGEEIKPQKIMVINNREEYSINLVDYLDVLLSDYGIEVGEPMSIKIGEEDTGVIVENLVIENPDTIFFCGNYNELATLITAARKAGMKTVFITETMGMDDNIFVLSEAQYLEGLIAIIPDPPSLAKYSQDSRAADFWYEFNSYLSEMDNGNISIESPGQYAPYCYDAVFVLIEAMEKANSILPGDFIDELKTTSFDGIAGNIEFDSNGDRVNPKSTVFIVKDGSWGRY